MGNHFLKLVIASSLSTLLLSGCGKDKAEEASASAAKAAPAQPAPEEAKKADPKPAAVDEATSNPLCKSTLDHLNKLIVGDNPESQPSAEEQAVIDIASKASLVACEAEGLSQAQADCITAITDPTKLREAMECQAIKDKKPSWFR